MFATLVGRPRDGLDAARARGRIGGQLGPDGHRKHTVQQIADEFGVTRPTIYRRFQRPLAEQQRGG